MTSQKAVAKTASQAARVRSQAECITRFQEALNDAYGYGLGAAKALARDADIPLPTARNLIEGRNTPSFLHLLYIVARCDEVAAAFWEMTGRDDLSETTKKAAAIRRALEALESAA